MEEILTEKLTVIPDDRKDDYLPRLEKSYIYQTLVNKALKTDPEVISLVNSAVSYSVQRTKTIIRHMDEFTLHDSEHLFRVLNIMCVFH